MPVALLTAGAGCPRTRSTAGAIDADETEDDDEEGKSSPTTSGGTQLRSQLVAAGGSNRMWLRGIANWFGRGATDREEEQPI